MSTRQRKAFATTVVTGVVAMIAILASGGDSHVKGPHSSGPTPKLPVYHMDADSASYTTVGDIVSASDVIAVGKVESQSTEPGVSPGVDAEGEPLPAIPHTNYVVGASSVLKGAIAPGTAIVISLAGGATEKGTFVLDGGPELNDGETRLFFLRGGSDGRFYPLAGGAAIATQQSDGSYALPAQATGAEPLVVTEAALRGSTGQQNSSLSGSNGGNTTASNDGLAARTTHLGIVVHLLPHQRLATVLARGLRLRTTCSQSCTVNGELAVGAKVAKSLKLAHARRGVIVGAGHSSSGSTLILRFTSDARRRLREHSRISLTLTIRASNAHAEKVTVKGIVNFTPTGARLSR